MSEPSVLPPEREALRRRLRVAMLRHLRAWVSPTELGVLLRADPQAIGVELGHMVSDCMAQRKERSSKGANASRYLRFALNERAHQTSESTASQAWQRSGTKRRRRR